MKLFSLVDIDYYWQSESILMCKIASQTWHEVNWLNIEDEIKFEQRKFPARAVSYVPVPVIVNFIFGNHDSLIRMNNSMK